MEILTMSFLQAHPAIKYASRSSAHYPTWRANFATNLAQPLVIMRPQAADDVAAIVSYCVAQKLDFAVRSGGHDICGRSTVQGAVTIDMRDICQVNISKDKKTARIGGGILLSELLEELGKQDLVTPVGGIGTVGYVGWATLGGYGPYSPSYGLGLDQIVAAKIVNAEGKLTDADGEMLKGVRGAGGNIGVIVELTVKVYPCKEVQAGMVFYNSSDITGAFTTFFENYNKLLLGEKLPVEMYIQPSVFTLPNLGPSFLTLFLWNGPNSNEAQRWLSLISNLAPVAQIAVKTTTPVDYINEATAIYPTSVFGRSQTVSISKYSPQAISVMAKHVPCMPQDPCTGLSIHSIRGPSCEPPFPPSVWRNRESHYMIEILGMGSSEEAYKISEAWAGSFHKEMSVVEGVLEGTYISLTGDMKVELAKIFGEHLAELKMIKAKYDPNKVFKYSVPQL